MIHLDANVVLRYLLRDDEVLFQRAIAVIDGQSDIFIATEVMAEIVYILQKIYAVERARTSIILLGIIDRRRTHMSQKKTIREAMGLYAQKNIDFVDALLIARHKVEGVQILSFDEKLNRLLANTLN